MNQRRRRGDGREERAIRRNARGKGKGEIRGEGKREEKRKKLGTRLRVTCHQAWLCSAMSIEPLAALLFRGQDKL